jgi:hypothetical protein
MNNSRCCDKLKSIGKPVWEEVTFWVEVFAEYCGWDRSPYHWVFEQYERDLEDAKHSADIERKRAKYLKKTT